jgi:lipopolysaccharide export system permease protein
LNEVVIQTSTQIQTMKKLDKLILRSFIGPFILTFVVVVFILLMVQMLRHFDDIIGKDLGLQVIAQLLFYFAVFTSPTALPLAVLLSCLITFGNLGEHFELTAIKNAGISLTRTFRPILVVVIGLTALAFCINNYLVPRAALEAYSLIFDIKQKKPALDLLEGTFYGGLNDISIKVDRKFKNDPAALKGVVVYDHRKRDGNRDVIKADSGRMSTILGERYLKFELFNGYNYREGVGEEHEMTGKKTQLVSNPLTRSRFDKTQIIFDLSSFDLIRNSTDGFSGLGIMRNMDQLETGMDSLRLKIIDERFNYYSGMGGVLNTLRANDRIDLPADLRNYQLPEAEQSQKNSRIDLPLPPPRLAPSHRQNLDSLFAVEANSSVVESAGNRARQVRGQVEMLSATVEAGARELRIYRIQWHKILASSFACLAMFLIGAPLGSIIRKGGLGVPFLISILFFIIYFILTMQGEKLARQDVVGIIAGVWVPDFLLLIVGLYFLRQARLDARVFDPDVYQVMLAKFRLWLAKRGILVMNFKQ